MSDVVDETDELIKKYSLPKEDPFWDRVGRVDGKEVVGHYLTDRELKLEQSYLGCGPTPWVVDFKQRIVWRWYTGE